METSGADHLNTEVIKGLDVSRYQKSLDFHQAKALGYSFCMIKATQGKNIKNPIFDDQVRKCQDEGLKFGFYHFFDDAISACEQSDFFLSQIAPYSGPMSMLPALDCEIAFKQPPLVAQSLIGLFLQIASMALDMPTMLYGPTSFLASLNFSKEFAKHPLWLAHYGVKAPLVPKPWSEQLIWQTGQVVINGVEVDENIFNGSHHALETLTQRTLSPAV